MGSEAGSGVDQPVQEEAAGRFDGLMGLTKSDLEGWGNEVQMRTSATIKNPMDSGAATEDGYSMPREVEKAGWLTQIWHLFAHDKLVNGLMLLGIIVGFFQGWLKHKFRAGWVTFAFDIPVTLAWLACVLSVPRGRRLFPDCNMSKVLIALTAMCVLYVIIPFGVPWLVAVASFRAWCFIPLFFLVGYHTTRSVRQMEVYLWLLVLLGAFTATYALFQTPEEVREMMKNDPEMTFRLQNQFYADSQGRGVFRRFSTFVSSAAFGGMMTYCTTFAISRLVHPGCSVFERLILIGSSAIMTYGVILSGARSGFLSLLTGFAFAIWYRRESTLAKFAPFILAPGMIGVLVLQGSSVMERLSTLLDPAILWQRVYIVLSPALENISNHPFGDGLGRSGHGVPVIFSNLSGSFEMRPIDGDLGRMAVDMGIPGLIILTTMVVLASTDAFRWMRKLRGSPLGLIGLPAGSMFVLVAPFVVYGSPFLGIPGGVLVWFFLGAMRRLVEDYDKLVAVAGQEVADVSDQFVSFITPKRLMPLYKQDPRNRTSGSRMRGLTTKGASPARAESVREATSSVSRPMTGAAGRIGSASSATLSAMKLKGAGKAPRLHGAAPQPVTKRFLFRRPADSPDRRRPRD